MTDNPLKKYRYWLLACLLAGGVTMSLALTQQGTQSMSPVSQLTPKQQSIAAVAAFTARGDLPHLEKALADGLDSGVTLSEIKEVLLQMYAYTGFPRSLNAITTLMQVVKKRREAGIQIDEGKPPSPIHFPESRQRTGQENQTRLTGQPVEAQPGNFVEFMPEINLLLQEHLFADIFARDTLSWQEREIATIAALSALGNVDSQLGAHISAGLNTGLSEPQIKGIFTLLGQQLESASATSGISLLDEVMMERPRQ